MASASIASIRQAIALAFASTALFSNPASAGTVYGAKLQANAVQPAVAANTTSAARRETGEIFHGSSTTDLVVSTWRHMLSLPFAFWAHPDADTTGSDCASNQEGSFWFLTGGIVANFTITCTVPAGKALVVPVFGFLNDYPCPDPNYHPAPGQTFLDFLLQGVTPIIDTLTVAEAFLDGRPHPVKRVSTGVFGFTASADLIQIDSCNTGSPMIGASDGYFTFVDPLPRGDHTLEVRSVGSLTGVADGTFVIKVR
jgi:hypothetical protein